MADSEGEDPPHRSIGGLSEAAKLGMLTSCPGMPDTVAKWAVRRYGDGPYQGTVPT
jgi:hypothetical protein